MSLSSKTFHLVQDPKGIHETTLEFQDSPLFCVLCDALYLSHPEKNFEIARDFERVIKKYLWTQKPHLNEKILVKALEEAQKHFLKNYAKESKLLKLSVLLVIQPTQSKKEPFFYAVGMGDFKLFQMDKSGTLLFYDPETPQLPANLSLKKRFNCLTNAIGQSHARASIQKIPLEIGKSLLLLSYGVYHSIPEEKWLQYAVDFENKKSLLSRSFSRVKDKEHLKHLLYFSLQLTQQTPMENLVEDISIQTKESTPTTKKTFYALNWAFKIVALLIIGLCILELTQTTPLKPSRATHSLLRFIRKEPEMNLSLHHSNLKLFTLPQVRERAFVVDMKNKYERQAYVIEKLHHRIKEQDQALRDLQVKAFQPISSKEAEKLQDPEPNETPHLD